MTYKVSTVKQYIKPYSIASTVQISNENQIHSRQREC